MNVGAADANAKFQTITAAYETALQAAKAAPLYMAGGPSRSRKQHTRTIKMADYDASFFAFAQDAVSKSLRPENNVDDLATRRQRARGEPTWA